MAIPDYLTRIGVALDSIERYIGGDTSIQNPINIINGIRITLTTARQNIETATQAFNAVNARRVQYLTERDQLRNLLNATNNQVNDLMNTLQIRTQMYTLALDDERDNRRVWCLRSKNVERKKIALKLLLNQRSHKLH